MQDEDRRRQTRIDSVHLVEVSAFDEEGFCADLATGRTLNLSVGGIRLELHHPLPLRSVVKLHLILGRAIHEVQGRVVYLEELEGGRCAMGIQFEHLDPAVRDALESEVAENHS